MKQHYGLLGRHLSHSFSKGFFTDKFTHEGIDASYLNYEMEPEKLKQLREFIQQDQAIRGLNVTIPYKEEVKAFVDSISDAARAIGAINVIRIVRRPLEGLHLMGDNTDCIGFKQSLSPLLSPDTEYRALVFGTGGAAKAVWYVLDQLGIPYQKVSRTASSDALSYAELTPEIIQSHLLLINTTPLGMYPNVGDCPDFPYQALGEGHVCYDLIYNPEKTLFLTQSEAQGARVKNGLEMLHIQALAAWDIWQRED